MAGAIRDKCGVLGLYSPQTCDIAVVAHPILEALNHRGQESWGIAVPNYDPYKRSGLVLEGILYENDMEHLRKMEGNCAVGHVRYSTKGSATIGNAHPIQISNHSGKFFEAMNGTIENSDEIARRVLESGLPVDQSCTDTEIFGMYLGLISNEISDFNEAFQKASEIVNGSYSFTFLKDNTLFAARDPMAYKPLCIGYDKESGMYIVASESVALYRRGAELVRDVRAGEMISIDKNGINSFQFAKSNREAHCIFEYTYFAHPSSVIDGINVYLARKSIGRGLGSRCPTNDVDVVIPVPDSARPLAAGFSEISGIQNEEGLIKDKYNKKMNQRSFLATEQQKRIETVKSITAIKPIINDKNVLVVDDSIVRGTSSRQIVQILKRAGAKKVGFASAFPPIRYPCYMGIDFPTQEELVAYNAAKDVDDISEIGDRVAKEIGADFAFYNDAPGLLAQIGIAKSKACTSCITGNYECLNRKPRFRSREEMKGCLQPI